jgi:hypothetical protein
MYMELRRHHPQRVAAAKTGFSERTGRRIEGDPRLPSQKAAERPLRRQVADPLGGLWESDILPLLVTRPGVRPVTVLEEMQRSHPDRDWHRLRRTLERRVRAWCAEHGAEREVIFRQDHEPGQQALSDFTDMADAGVQRAGAARQQRTGAQLRWARAAYVRRPRAGTAFVRRAAAACADAARGAPARPQAGPAARIACGAGPQAQGRQEEPLTGNW